MKIPILKLKPLARAVITVRQPSKWTELTRNETWQTFRALARNDISIDEIPSRVFLKINNISVFGRNARGSFLCMKGTKLFELTPEVLAELAIPLKFILKDMPAPWRPDAFGKYNPQPSDLSETSFGDWLVIDNIMQGVIHTKDLELLDKLIPYLFTNRRKPEALLPEWRVAIFRWLTSLRDYVSRRFPDLYVPAGGNVQESAISARAIEESVDAQIRILTKGDITKEDEIMAANMYRALAELNARAREYKELKNIRQ